MLLFAPYVTTLVASATVWRYLFGTRFGLINAALTAIGAPPIDWLGDPRWSLPAILIFVAWKVFGYNMVVFGAALAAVPVGSARSGAPRRRWILAGRSRSTGACPLAAVGRGA